MASITVKADFKPVRALMEGFSERRIKTTIAIALTKTAQIAQKEVIKEIRKFDRPTAWALGSTEVINATKDRQIAYVWLKDRHGKPQEKSSNYLVPQVFGGPRDRKAYETALMNAGLRSNEYTVPAKGMPLDAFGNLPAATIRTIMSQLKVAGDQEGKPRIGYTSNKTNSARSKRTVARRGTYFIPRPGSGLPRGVYQRIKTGLGWAHRMVLKIVVGRPKYQQRLPIFAIAERVTDQHFQAEFDKAFEASLARLKQRNATR